ncbi:MAG: TonB-dependent receptor [Bacteroidota bacterium]|nr:TonB-dependent receptor [Bacteroidota bacterium]
MKSFDIHFPSFKHNTMQYFVRQMRFFFCISFLAVTYLNAGTTGKISGRITDKSTGEGLVGASIQIEGTTRGTVCDPDGYYSLINLSPGKYTLIIRFIGYHNITVRDIEVNVDLTAKRDVQLVPDNIQMDVVLVQADVPIVTKDRTFSAAVVSAGQIEAMPVTEVGEVIALQAGVVQGSDGALHFRGGRSREVGYIIDGVNVTNSFSQDGGNNVQIENSVVQQVEVISGTFNAEYGSAQSGIVNIVTKSAAESFTFNVRAQAGEWYSGNTSTFLAIDKINPLANRDVQASVSGPIFPQKLSFYASGRLQNNESYLWYEKRFTALDGWKIAAYQRWYGEHFTAIQQAGAINIPDSLSTGDGSKGPLNTSQNLSLHGKLDYFFSSDLRLSYQLFFAEGESRGGGANRRYQPDEPSTSVSQSFHHFVSWAHTPSENFFYNIRGSYQYNWGDSYYRKDNRIARYPGDVGIQPISSSSEGFSLGTTGGIYRGSDLKNYRKLYLVNGDANWQADRTQFIKMGFEVKQHDINTYSRGPVETDDWSEKKWTTAIKGNNLSWNDYWTSMINYWDTLSIQRYRSVSDSEVTRYRDYTIRPLEVAAYLQDKVELGDVIMNLGIRLDAFQPNEKVINNPRVESYSLGSAVNLKEAPWQYQLSPRFGLSFPISVTGVFHVAYGHFFQMPSFQKLYNEPLHVLTALQLEGLTLGNATLKPERTIAYEIGMQQGLTEDVAVDVTAFYKDVKNLLGIEALSTVDNVAYRRYINRDYGNVRGLTVALRYGGNGFISGFVNYSLQIAKGSSSDPEFIQLIQTATSIGGEPVEFIERKIISLDWDQTHTLNAVLTLQEVSNWSLSFIGSFSNGLPFTPVFVERRDIAVREFLNAERKPTQWNLDLKAQKMFSFVGINTTFFLKVNNVFDLTNEVDVYSSTGRATYNARSIRDEELLRDKLQQEGLFTLNEVDARPTWYSEPRRIEFGFEINF